MHRWIASALFLAVPGIAGGAEPSVQETVLRAKPAVLLVLAEVTSEVTVTCPTGGPRRVTPVPFRETGTGWFISPSGWVVTNGHVVSPAHRPHKGIAEQQQTRAVDLRDPFERHPLPRDRGQVQPARRGTGHVGP